MKPLDEKYRNEIIMSFFEKVKDEETRRRIMTTAFHYSDENPDQPDALNSMVYYLTENQEKVDEFYKMFAGAVPVDAVEAEKKPKSKRKKA